MASVRVHAATLFDKEDVVAGVALAESAKFVDEHIVVEADHTFTYRPKTRGFPYESLPHVRYEPLDSGKLFEGPRLRRRKNWPFLEFSVNPWENDRRQRNAACSFLRPAPTDLVILADVDEIIDPRSWDRVAHYARRHGIVTIGLHHTMYFFNLFSSTNLGGPPDYSHRVFIMTGRYFSEMADTSDSLRKAGEAGKLINEVFRVPEISGFHHSWLGDADRAAEKLRSYAHSSGDHQPELFDSEGQVNQEAMKAFIADKKSPFGPRHKLEVREDIDFLETVSSQRSGRFLDYFV